MESAAARSPAARKLLEGPECPEELEYLLRWARELARTRAVGMNGAEGITYPMIEAWARLTAREPSALEVEGLLLIDAAMRFPGDGGEEE